MSSREVLVAIKMYRKPCPPEKFSDQTKEYKKKMLAATRDEAKKQYRQRRRRIDEINSELLQTISKEDHDAIQSVTEKSREHKLQKGSKQLKEKFERLSSIKDQEDQRATKTPKLQHEVYDLTKQGIDEDVKAYLKLGPDFCETPRRLPYKKVIETERMCKVIEDEKESKPEEAEKLQ